MKNSPLEKFISGYSNSTVDWIGLRELEEITTHRIARDGLSETNDVTKSHGVMVEVLANGQFGYAATPRTDLEGLKGAADRAVEQALQASRFSVFKFSTAQRPQVTGDYFTNDVKPFGSISLKEVTDLLIEVTLKLKTSPKIIRTSAIARLVESQTHFVSSNGSNATQKFSMITTGFEATAQEGSIVQKRTDGGMRGRSYQGGWEHLWGGPNGDQMWDRVKRVAAEALELVAAEECPTQTSALILAPDQMMLQIHESIGHPLEIDRILGDERIYAGWSFVKKEDFGTLQYGSPLMNVTFDPEYSQEFASYSFDDTGTPAKREFLIQDGILKRGLGGMESQARSGLPGVANSRASSWNRSPIDRMANLNLEPGTSSREEMISSVENGVLMESNRSWSIDDFRNTFQFGCEYGRLIENGKLTRVVRNPNYRGITNPFWRGLKKVGNASTREVYGTPYCGKGEPNQIIRVGHASPICLFENVEIFGGAK